MKVKISNKQVIKKKPFPKLMVSSESGKVIYALKEKCGCIHGVVISEDKYPFENYRTDWIVQSFTDFEGSITLEND